MAQVVKVLLSDGGRANIKSRGITLENTLVQ